MTRISSPSIDPYGHKFNTNNDNINKIMTTFQLDVDGAHGANARNGSNGTSYRDNGKSGTHGKDASQATSGRDAGNIALYLSLQGSKIGLKTADDNSSAEQNHELNLDTVLELSAIGGNGGHGGNGGDGGNGGKGKKGKVSVKS